MQRALVASPGSLRLVSTSGRRPCSTTALLHHRARQADSQSSLRLRPLGAAAQEEAGARESTSFAPAEDNATPQLPAEEVLPDDIVKEFEVRAGSCVCVPLAGERVPPCVSMQHCTCMPAVCMGTDQRVTTCIGGDGCRPSSRATFRALEPHWWLASVSGWVRDTPVRHTHPHPPPTYKHSLTNSLSFFMQGSSFGGEASGLCSTTMWRIRSSGT
jgi:hypothetical protein